MYNRCEHGVIKLSTVIYADILIITNIIVNYLLLRASAAICGNEFKATRFLLASFAGGFLSLIIFIDNIPAAINLLIKILFTFLIVLIAYKAKSLKSFLKCSAAFFTANFVFAGIMMAACTAFFPNKALYQNGVIYFDIDMLTLTIGAVLCYCILSLISRLTKSRVPQKSIYTIKLTYNKKSVEGKALFDSGNNLCDCFSGRPVIIAEKSLIKPILFGEDLFEMKNFRLIPFSTIKNSGTLPAFSADKAEILTEGGWVEAKNVYIGITEKKIVSGGYSVLLGTPFFDAIDNNMRTERGRKQNDNQACGKA